MVERLCSVLLPLEVVWLLVALAPRLSVGNNDAREDSTVAYVDASALSAEASTYARLSPQISTSHEACKGSL